MTDPNYASVLVVDDSPINRDLLTRHLRHDSYTIAIAESGIQALDLLQSQSFDLILLDVMMPGMDGYEVLKRVKASPEHQHIPVIMISALNDLEVTARCIELGAEDYLLKPFNRTLLAARINASLQKKRLYDLEKAYTERLRAEQEKSERLLLNILPLPVAERLKQGEQIIAESFPEVTVLFADIVDFTRRVASISPRRVVELLNDIFSTFDALAEHHGLEKIKTIGDAYMVVGGVPIPKANHAEAVADMALDMQSAIANYGADDGVPFTMRIGIHTGSVIAGVIGTKKFTFDLWGDTVNTASRMETYSLAGRIQVTEATYAHLKDHYNFETRGRMEIKGKGQMHTFFLVGKR